jgi:hypothetical protein
MAANREHEKNYCSVNLKTFVVQNGSQKRKEL